MVVSALLLLATRPRVVLKPVRAFGSHAPRGYGKQNPLEVWVDRRNTGVCVPDWREDPRWALDFHVVREFSNTRRDLGGEFNEIYRGAMNGEYHHPFSMVKGGRFALLPSTPGGNNPSALGVDGMGRLLVLDDPPATNLGNVRHAYLWGGVAWLDVGPADEARIDGGGTVRGSFASDKDGRPLEPIDYGGLGFRVRFRWKDGQRTDSKPYQA